MLASFFDFRCNFIYFNISADETTKTAEAIVEIGICQLSMNNLNNAQKSFERAFKIYTDSQNIEGICETKMHLAAVLQRFGNTTFNKSKI